MFSYGVTKFSPEIGDKMNVGDKSPDGTGEIINIIAIVEGEKEFDLIITRHGDFEINDAAFLDKISQPDDPDMVRLNSDPTKIIPKKDLTAAVDAAARLLLQSDEDIRNEI